VLARLVALVAASAILVGLFATLAASIDEPADPGTSAHVAQRGGTLPTLALGAASVDLTAFDGLDLLQAIGTVDRATLIGFADAHPEAIDGLLDEQPPAAVVTSWWAGVEPRQRRVVIAALPGLVGNLDGIPFAVRDAANRQYLAHLIDGLGDELDEASGRTARAAATTQLAMLNEVALALGDPGDSPVRSLIAVDDTWPGRAVVALGDLDTADYVSYLVPGMFFTVQGQIVDWTEIALDIHRDKTALIADGLSPGDAPTTATVAWMGYETPNLFTVGTLDQAEEGAAQLESTVAGLRATRGDDQPHVSLITHSYGSTAASIALARGGLDIDALAIAGSPGVSVDRVEGLGLTGDAVFVAEAAWDPVVDSAFHGVDPGSDGFGAVVMNVSGGHDDVTGGELEASTGHLGYFARQSESMRNFALIGLGRGDLVSGGEGRHLLASGR
jgi:hypothetical protein